MDSQCKICAAWRVNWLKGLLRVEFHNLTQLHSFNCWKKNTLCLKALCVLVNTLNKKYNNY